MCNLVVVLSYLYPNDAPPIGTVHNFLDPLASPVSYFYSVAIVNKSPIEGSTLPASHYISFIFKIGYGVVIKADRD